MISRQSNCKNETPLASPYSFDSAHAPPDSAPSDSAPPKQDAAKGAKITVAGASWCGFTNKMVQAIDASDSRELFEVVDCAKQENKETAVCKASKGFPTMSVNGQVCAVGFQGVEDVVSKCL